MVKLDASLLRYLSTDEQRVLLAVEMGMKNHEIVPTPLICSISNMKRSFCHGALKNLHRHKLIFHESRSYDGYKLNYSGYDYLALVAMSKRDSIVSVGKQIGVGKESDIFVVRGADGKNIALKLHRLGRTSFRAIKNKRDYLKHRKSASWLYMSRLAAMKEYAFMKVLYEHGFPVPRPVDHSRHAVAMELVDGYSLCTVTRIEHPAVVYSALMNLIIMLVRHGLIHCDFNEYNIMIDKNERITLIDFPQMVSTNHPDAEMYFDRDVECVRRYFRKKYGFESSEYPRFTDYVEEREMDLDREVEASGHFTRKQQAELDRLVRQEEKARAEAGEDFEEAVEGDEEEQDGGEEQDEEQDEEDEVEPVVEEDEDPEDAEHAMAAAELLERKEESDEEEALESDIAAKMRREILERNRLENDPAARAASPSLEEEEPAQPVLELEVDDAATAAVEGGDGVDADEEEEAEPVPKKKKKRAKRSAASISDEIIRQRVKKNLARRTREKKRNTNKGKAAKEMRDVKHDAADW